MTIKTAFWKNSWEMAQSLYILKRTPQMGRGKQISTLSPSSTCSIKAAKTSTRVKTPSGLRTKDRAQNYYSL